jgi:hypothetical protein
VRMGKLSFTPKSALKTKSTITTMQEELIDESK